MVLDRKSIAAWKFIASDTLVTLMSPKLTEKLTDLQKPITPRKALTHLDPKRSVLDSHSRIMQQTRNLQWCKPPRRSKIYVRGIRFLRLTDPRVNSLSYVTPFAALMSKETPFYLEWTPPGPIQWPTDFKRFFEYCHVREFELAARLGLSCHEYWDSARRIYLARVYSGKYGLPLRKIDAQRACRIPYKKAGSLYSALKSVGWLRRKLFIYYWFDEYPLL